MPARTVGRCGLGSAEGAPTVAATAAVVWVSDAVGMLRVFALSLAPPWNSEGMDGRGRGREWRPGEGIVPNFGTLEWSGAKKLCTFPES